MKRLQRQPGSSSTGKAEECFSYMRKRTRHGDVSMSTGCGPSSPEELVAWPHRTVQTLKDNSPMWVRFMTIMTAIGCTIGTLYSGCLTPEIGLGFVLQAASSFAQCFKFASAFAADIADGPGIMIEHIQ